jgi:O-methyltransferase involved in polyketide biosynthesis
MFGIRQKGIAKGETMSRGITSDLQGVSETLLLPLYYRAVEYRRADALLRDDRAVQIVRRLDYNFARLAGSPQQQLFAILRTCEFDRCVKDFLERHPQGLVVDLGCGLDTRFWRVDNGQVVWFDLDLPPVIRLRRQLLDEGPRCHFMAYSLLDFAWMDCVCQADGRPVLLLAEGVFPYLAEADVRRFVLGVSAHLGEAELIFDAMSANVLWLHNLQLATANLEARLHWGFQSSRDLERWGPGIHLAREWTYFDRPEPRLGWMNQMRCITPIRRAQLILHYTIDGSGEGRPPTTHGDSQHAL